MQVNVQREGKENQQRIKETSVIFARARACVYVTVPMCTCMCMCGVYLVNFFCFALGRVSLTRPRQTIATDKNQHSLFFCIRMYLFNYFHVCCVVFLWNYLKCHIKE